MPKAKKGEVNYNAMDRFTFIHFGIGCLYGFAGLPFWSALVFAVGWELIENYLKIKLTFLFPNPTADTLRNSIFDSIAVVLGWALVCYLKNR